MSTATSRVGSARPGAYRSFTRGSSSSGSGSSSENLPPRALARVAREIRDLHKNPPEGVRLVVDSDTGVPGSLGEVLAELEGPTDTPYEKRFFQLKLVLSSDFPATPPRGFFLTKIYHPNVDMSSGAICVNTLKKDWTATTTFAHVLSVVRCLLIIPFPESSLNDEAGRLFMDSYVEYARRAKLMAGVHGKSKPFSSDEEENDLEEKNSTLVEAKTSSGVENSGDSDVFDGKLVSGSSTSLRSSSSSMPSVPVRSGSKGSLRSNPDKLNRSGSLNSTSSDRSSLKMRTEKINKKKSLKRL